MSRENVEIFRRAIEAFNVWNIDAITELVTPDFDFVPYLAATVETTSYRGPDGLRKYRADTEAVWDEIHVRIDAVRDLGDRLVAFGELRARGRGSGLETRAPLTWVVEFSGGRLSAVRSYQDRSEALEAAGLSE
jgi:ketosteroid isomerase-like protein